MWIPFEELPAEARVWIYQANRTLSAEAQQTVIAYLKDQLQAWNSHGAALKASAKLFYNRFVVIAANESHQAPSGCSIDKSVHWLKDLSNALETDFFDRSAAFLKDGRVETIALTKLKKSVEEGLIQPGSILFNNTVQTKAQLEKDWLVAAGNSWMSRYFAVDKQII